MVGNDVPAGALARSVGHVRVELPAWLRRRWGVRAVAALSATVFVAISLALAGIALVVLQDRAVRALIEQQVRAHAVSVAARLAAGVTPAAAVATGGSGFEVLQVLNTAGTVLAASPQLTGAPPLHTPQASVPDTVAEHPGSPLLDNGPLLVIERPVETAAGTRVVLAAGSLAVAARGTQTVSRLAILGVPLLSLLAGAATYALSGRALRPVEDIRAQVADWGDRDLHRRVPEPYAQDEVGRLARTMNTMLTRLQDTHTAQRRFLADASHELRSPLAAITARLELGALRGPTNADLAAMTAETQRMTRLIQDLLLLARADERGLAPRRGDVDLDELLDTEATRLRDTTALRVRVNAAPVRINGDRAQLTRAIRNLTDNAARHASSHVALRLRLHGGEAILQVADDGPGIPAAERARVFERFVRLDPGRARDTGGSGLGLAIVTEVINAHSGSVQAGETAGGGAILTVRLPVQPARPAPLTPRTMPHPTP